MARIPEFQRGRLASSAVGVAPPDFGDARIAESIADAASTIAVVELRKQEDKRQANLRANARIQSVVDTTAANREGINLDQEFDQVARTASTSDEFLTQTDEILASRSGQFPDDRTRALVESVGVKSQRRALDLFNTRKQTENLQAITNNLNGSIEGISTRINREFSSPALSFDEKLEMFDSQIDASLRTIETARPALSPKALKEFRENSAEAITRASVLGLMESNPEEVPAFLDAVVSSGIISAEEEAGFLADAAKLVERRKAVQDTAEAAVIQKTEADMTRKALDGTLTVSEVALANAQGRTSPGFDKDVKEVLTSANAVKAGTAPATVLEISSAIAQLPQKRTGRRRSKKSVVNEDKATLGELALIRQQILRAHAEGTITATDGKNFLAQITPAFGEKVSDVIDGLNGKAVAGGNLFGDGPAEFWLESEDEIRQANASMATLFMQRIAQFESEQGRRMSVSESHILAAEVKEEFLLSVESDKAALELGQITNHPTFGFVRVVGFKANGEALLDNDLSAPIKEPLGRKSLNGDR